MGMFTERNEEAKELFNIMKKKVRFDLQNKNQGRSSAYCTSIYCPFYNILCKSCRVFGSLEGERSKKCIEIFGE